MLYYNNLESQALGRIRAKKLYCNAAAHRYMPRTLDGSGCSNAAVSEPLERASGRNRLISTDTLFRPIRRRRLLVTILALIAGLAFTVAAIHSPAPPLPLRTLSGTPVSRTGPRIVMFWRADCAPCRLELADLKALRAAALPMRIDLVGLQPPTALRSALGATGMSEKESLRTPYDPTRPV
jgi:hypothetical protein